ncbi:MAG TPA: thioredoxin domain-containing protein [Phycisphaerales bacterium]|nr:thioredoxin domain-containing protein [Phycisphaerales bacterium]
MDERAEGRRGNRLVGALSPYLLQHAHNPVEWWPWGEEAIAEARRRGVPILLSVGYSTCYWCHVMERESFEDEATAGVMNEHFVCVKLDREERPDIDDIYMNALLVTRGNGGWPMNVFLEPEKLRPIWCGTYFPPSPAMNLPSWVQILRGVHTAWTTRRGEVLEQAERIAEAVRENLEEGVGSVALIGEGQVAGAVQQLLAMHDKVNGGFGGAPKFPQPLYLRFLKNVKGVADEQTCEAIFVCVKNSLDALAAGGIYDQVGGGFHRYCVDATWTVPHFEKMLYDNAQLLLAMCEGADATGQYEEYQRVARETAAYVLREMSDEAGGFYSAQDAEVDGREGLNYVWTEAGVREALGEGAEADLAVRVYGLDRGANFQDPHHRDATAVNVLRLESRLDKVAGKVGIEYGVLRERMGEINRKLYEARQKRVQPRRDDKVIASWNGMMIEAMAWAGFHLQDVRYVRAAERAAQFVLREMMDSSGSLVRSWRKGVQSGPGFLEDSAAVISGLLALVEVRGDAEAMESATTASYLAAAERLAERAVEDFKDVSGGRVRWCDTRAGQGDLFVRSSAMHDGVMPSGLSAMLGALISLATMTAKERWRIEAVEMLHTMSGAIGQSPVGCIEATRGLLAVLRDREMRGMFESVQRASSAASAEGAAGEVGGGAVGGPHGGQDGGADAGMRAVEIYAAVDRVMVTEEMPAQFTLVIKVAEGHHIMAADPGEKGAGLVPLRVGIVHGSGVQAYADYPPGEPYGDGVLVHRGTIEVPVVLELSGDWKGRPLVSVTYQACTETECLRAVVVELDVGVERG